MKIAVIGAGIAGLTCATELKASGHEVTVFEKSRGLGGRLATRRTDDGFQFDHGAQYFTCRTDKFSRSLSGPQASGALERWSPPGKPASDESDWLVGTPTMNAFLKADAASLPVRLGMKVTSVRRADKSWTVTTDVMGDISGFDAIILAVPAPQAEALCHEAPELAAKIRTATMAPCWTLMLGFDRKLETGFDVRRSPGPSLDWLARNSAKPGRNSAQEAWVAHATPEWSTEHLELDRKEVIDELLPEVLAALGAGEATPSHIQAHRWRYARVTTPAGEPYLSNTDNSLFAIGDWCLGPRVECAAESGLALADALGNR